MAKFRKGDRVRLLCDRADGRLYAGALGTVTEDDVTPYVEWDGYTHGHDGDFNDGRNSVWAVGQSELEFADRSTSSDASIVAILLAAGHVTQEQVTAARALVEAR